MTARRWPWWAGALLAIAAFTGCGGSPGGVGSSGSAAAPSSLVNGPPINSYTCASFQYQEDAQANYSSQLDADHDGIACEALPHRPH